MSGRPTADIVADLRLNAIKPFLAQSVAVEQYVKDAADRLTELDAEWQRLVRIAHASSLFQGGAGDRDPVVGLINALEMGGEAIEQLAAVNAALDQYDQDHTVSALSICHAAVAKAVRP